MFNLYFAGSMIKGVEEYLIEKKCCRLCSQLNEKNIIEKYSKLPKEVKPKFLVDSGAFSVAHAGKTVNIDEYINFINANDDVVDYWVELDVIPYPVLNQETAVSCANASWDNYVYMVQRVNNPYKILPLYHFGEPKEHLMRILNTPVIEDKPAPYIGIGGRHGVSAKEQEYYFERVFDIIKHSSNPNVKVHAFGLTILDMLEKFPFYSADSTTWLQVGINGGVLTKYGVLSVSENTKFRKESLHQQDPKIVEAVMQECEKFGYTLEELSTVYRQRLKFNIDFMKDWADNYTYKPSKLRKNSLIKYTSSYNVGI